MPTLRLAFDCDGTLVDSEPLHNRADVAILAQYGIVLDPQEHCRRATGIGRTAVLRAIEQEHGIALPADVEQRIEAELQRLVAAELQAIPSAVAAITELAARGALLAVASNSNAAYIDQALQHCQLRGFFADRIACADRVERLKPAPDIYLLAARMLDASPEACIAVDDSAAGVASAHAAGMRAIGFCPPGHVFTPAQLRSAGAQRCIADLAELLDLQD